MSILLERPASRRCVRLFDDNYEYLAIVARANGISRDALIRSIVDKHVQALQNSENRAAQLIDILAVDFADDELCKTEKEDAK